MSPSGPVPSRSKRLSQSDWLLLEALDTRQKRPHQTGRFLTMHKRRRKRLITRSLTQDHALLDDIHHGQVQCILDKVNQWPFNAFILDNVTGGRSLPVLCVHLFHWYGLLDYFKLDVVRCWKFFTLIEEGYHSSNPYHNSIHATDVTQAMHCFLQEKKIREHLTPLEIMASLIAAVTHDLDHPGVNQPFLIATSNHLAALYENSSVLENHHWRSAIGCLLESHVAEELEDCRPELQRQISSLILATDITRQQEFLVRFKRYLDQNLLDMKLEEHRHFILQIALKCADISNPCRPWEVSKKWSQKVCEEFFRQGDYEKQLNLPVTALCDRQSTSVPKIQAGFFTFVVYPLFEEWHRFLGEGLSDDMMRNLHGNKLKWDALISQEKANESEVESSAANSTEEEVKEFSTPLSPSSETSPTKATGRNLFFSFRNSNSREKVGRRHSVPLSVPEPPLVSRTITRRESLAIGEKKVRTYFQSKLLVEEEEYEGIEAGEEEEELMSLGQSSVSLPSGNNSVGEPDEGGDGEKRPLSSENLLPDLSITSMTTVKEASRLSSVLNKGKTVKKTTGKSQLTRQQTFPPLQTSVRQRYFSTTAEMSKVSNAELESLRSSTQGEGNDSEKMPCGTPHGCKSPRVPKIVVLKEKNRSSLSDVDKQGSGRRDMDGSNHEKGVKVAKLFDDTLSDTFEKENIDPYGLGTGFDDDGSLSTRNGSTRKNSAQGLLHRRRGSAPVVSEIINPMALALRGCKDRYARRGSVPVNAIRCNTNDDSLLPMVQDFSVSQQHCPYQRRGSIPAEVGCPESGKPRNRNKKTLRRRRSGGPEMFCFSENGNENVRWKTEVFPKRPGGDSTIDSMTTRRRGSLPIDVLLITHSGSSKEQNPQRSRSRSCNGRGETPLHKAAIKGDEEMVARLLSEGADPNTPDFAGWTPLHEACNHGWYEIALALIKAGASVNARGLDDDTPLHDAAMNGHSELVQLLVESGADVNYRNKVGKTPGDVAAPGLMSPLLKFHSDVDSSPKAALKLHHIKKKFGKPVLKGTFYSYNSPQFSVGMEEKNNKEDVYEFKSSKEATPVRGTSVSPEVDKNGPESKSEKSGEAYCATDSDSVSSMKRTLSDVADNEEAEDETKRKKRKESDTKNREESGTSSKTLNSAGRTATVRNANAGSEKSAKAAGHATCKSSAPASKTASSSSGNSSNTDRKSPSSPKGSVAPSQHVNTNAPPASTSKTESEQDDKSSTDGEKMDQGPKVPPLKIVIPQQTATEPEQGNRNGKNGTSRHHQALPYVVSSNSNDGEKEGIRSRSVSPTDSLKADEKKDPAIGMLSAEDQKGSLNHQRVLRSSHRAGSNNNGENRAADVAVSRASSSGGQNTSATANVTLASSNNNSNNGATASGDSPSPQSQNRSSPSPQVDSNSSATTSAPASGEGSSNTQNSGSHRNNSTAPSKSNGGSSNSTSTSNYDDKASESNSESNQNPSQAPAPNPAPVELHPRKRKLKHNKEVKETPLPQVANERCESATALEVHPHEQPVKNCYQLFLDIRKQIERRRKGLFPVQPKPPQGFKDYLMNRCTYVLAGNASTRQIPTSPLPQNLSSPMKELFSEQEKERHRLRLQHVIEKEKLVLSVEQEILRVHGRAARALANQSLPFSACTILKDEEVYNLITPEQEEKDRNARSRYNGRLFLSWLQDVDDKWEKIKEAMLLRHHNEAESLHAVQKMDWEWKMKELGSCEFKSKPVILENHVPMVHVSDDFDLLPA